MLGELTELTDLFPAEFKETGLNHALPILPGYCAISLVFCYCTLSAVDFFFGGGGADCVVV